MNGAAAAGPGIHEGKGFKSLIFGAGTDIIEVQRVEEKLLRTGGLKGKLFTPTEIAYCEARHRPALHYAARFAAKEAFLKAMGTGWSGGHKFSEIEVVNNALGKPELFVHGKVKEFCEAHDVAAMEVSLTHVKDFASAVVVLEKKTTHP
ncbi:MAG: holo-ACP synthase [Candidatus Aminicenantes bacterium]|nr:holo-ACP synthase [Candidatus Aminicenantes bacterium]